MPRFGNDLRNRTGSSQMPLMGRGYVDDAATVLIRSAKYVGRGCVVVDLGEGVGDFSNGESLRQKSLPK